MKSSVAVESILEHYSSDNPALIGNLRRILMQGKLGGTGKMVILPVDQGFEHGPDRSFMINEPAYDPEYHIKFALEAGFNAYAAPLGMLEAVARKYSGMIPMILKINNASKLFPEDLEPVQVVTSTVNDALRLGCSAIGLTLYPGSAEYLTMIDEVRTLINAAKNSGLAVVIWSYPRGGELEKRDENALDIISYGVHMACLLGATIVKAKPPANYVKDDILLDYGDISSLSSRVRIVKRSAFNGKRLVVFSGGASKSEKELLSEIEQIIEGGADGSIVGRNMFQRDIADANAVINKIFDKYSVENY
ncbi:class I fructose-bisphosphate aldolase [Anaplasmataceae bacterium AB001_6]|nr:class I fructose-bisphosphate aldolase [Anaplasmataceae bacterium AB001_6]